jgi:hypothetical protein
MRAGADIRPLARAVVVAAVRDVRKGDRQAAYWLSWEGLAFLEVAGVECDPERWQRWVENGCPPGGV